MLLKPLYQYDDSKYALVESNTNLVDRLRDKTSDRQSVELDIRQFDNGDTIYVIVIDDEYLGLTRSEKEAMAYLNNAPSFDASELWVIAEIGEERFLARDGA